MIWSSPVTFINAVVVAANGRLWNSVRVRRGVVDDLGVTPGRGDVVVDAEQAIVCAGLINAHDHLELNSFGRLKWRSRHCNVREWIADFQPRFATYRVLAAARNETLADRLWVGGLKNLLSGVTTVCHHNPVHRQLRRRFPVRVVRRFGLSHSLQIDGGRVKTSFQRTPPAWPWIIHAAEGVDDEARNEVNTLAAWRCVAGNTVLVHGVALDGEDSQRVLTAGASLVWCPSSNEFLFGSTARVAAFDRAHRLALGTDSRMSGEGDLLDELRVAARTGQLSAEALLRTVSTNAASSLRLPDAGALAVGKPADLCMLRRKASDPFDSLVQCTRGDLRLTMIGGAPLVGDQGMRPVFAAVGQSSVDAMVDGAPRLVAPWIARRVRRMTIREPGLEVAC